MVSVLHRSPTEYGYYFVMVTLGFMMGTNIARYFSKSIPMNKMISIGACIGILGISLAIILQLLEFRQPLALFAPIAFSVVGNGIALPNAQAAAINEFPKIAGSASGLTGFLQMAFSAAAAQLVAIIYNGTVYPLLSLMLVASVLSLI